MVKNFIGREMKYLFNDLTLKFSIFPKSQDHSSMNGPIRATSAGFLTFYEYEDEYKMKQLGVECYGESYSLKLASNPERDSEVITRSFKEN